MNKTITYIIAGILAIAIGLYHINRVTDTLREIEVVEAQQMEEYQEELREWEYQMMQPRVRQYEMRTDTVDTITPQREIETREALPPPPSIPEPYTPSDRALEIKFWLDVLGSFLTTISPFAVPFILYRKKKEDS